MAVKGSAALLAALLPPSSPAGLGPGILAQNGVIPEHGMADGSLSFGQGSWVFQSSLI